MEKAEITLTVHGRDMTFSEQELIAILEKHFPNECTKQESTKNVIPGPTEDKWFEVNPQAIDQSIFQKKRKNERQEKTRQLILEAFAEVKNNPEKYGRKFKTMIPKKTWEYKTNEQLNQLACELGDHNADWVEQALEWAQRIYNGEVWGDICNFVDTANCYRMVVWKQGFVRLVGGSCNDDCLKSASDVGTVDLVSFWSSDNVVPLVVSYEN